MELFHRRYFAFFAFLFLFISFLAIFLSGTQKIIFAFAALALAIAAIAVLIFNKKHRFAFLTAVVSFAFICVALLNSFFFITLPREKASVYFGSEQTVKLMVILKSADYENSSEYRVRLTNIGGEEVSIKSYFYCDKDNEFSYGDQIITLGDITEPYSNTATERDFLLSVSAKEDAPMLLNRAKSINYFSADGIAYACDNIRSAFSNYVERLFGEEDGALVKGFLVNDKSDIPFAVYSDFKRSGTLHLLAVSGLHVALLMGALDLLLKKLFAPKKLRCILVSVCAVFFLILTNFAASAVRSVLMLLAVYMSYLFSEDDDTVTALFVSVFLITLFSPNSVYDLGMWMSFFATLGLVTVYPLFDKYVPRVKVKNKMLSVLLRFCRGIGAAVTLTLVANFFLLPIMWYFFGSISVSAIPANLLLSPLSAVYLPLCAIAVVLGWIPFLNKLLVLAASVLGRAVLFFVDFFADIRGGVLSLRYTFVTVIVILFSVALAVLLIVKLKHKLWIASPAVALVVAFSMSLLVYNLTYEPSLKYINRENNEILLFENGRSLSICDISSGSYSTLDEIYTSMPEYAVEIENFVLTHAHRAHVGLLERFIVNYPIRTLYLPLSNDKDELENITAIYLLAQVYDTDVKFYESGKEIALFDNIAIKPYFESNVSGHNCIYVNASDIFTYSDLSECDAAIENGAKSAYFLLGTHGEENLDKLPSATVSDGTKVIFANDERSQNSRLRPNTNSRVAPVENGIIKFKLPLE